jgi:hypothetical protein
MSEAHLSGSDPDISRVDMAREAGATSARLAGYTRSRPV